MARIVLDSVSKAFDKDVLFDDDLGTARSDQNGEFDIQFTELAFRDVVEARPDLYLRVFDPETRAELLSTKSAVRRNSNADEYFELHIPRGRR